MARPAQPLWRNLAWPLLDTSVHPLRYVLRAWPLAMAPTLAIALVLSIVFQLLGHDLFLGEDPMEPLRAMPQWMFLLMVVLFAPLSETLLMAPLLALLLRLWRGRRLPAALSSAAVWAVLHSLSALAWGLCIFWTFLSCSPPPGWPGDRAPGGTPTSSPPRSTPSTTAWPAWAWCWSDQGAADRPFVSYRPLAYNQADPDELQHPSGPRRAAHVAGWVALPFFRLEAVVGLLFHAPKGEVI